MINTTSFMLIELADKFIASINDCLYVTEFEKANFDAQL